MVVGVPPHQVLRVGVKHYFTILHKVRLAPSLYLFSIIRLSHQLVTPNYALSPRNMWVLATTGSVQIWFAISVTFFEYSVSEHRPQIWLGLRGQNAPGGQLLIEATDYCTAKISLRLSIA